jgi:Ca2+-transporting ATPase
VASLATDAQHGLSQAEARVRLERHGRNELTAEQPVPAWRKFLGQFRDVLVILLLIATAILAGLWLVERDSA